MKRKSENLENKLSDTTAPPLQRRRPPSYTRFSDKFYEVYKLFKATEVDIDEIEMHLVSLLDACNATKRAVEQNEIAIADKNNVRRVRKLLFQSTKQYSGRHYRSLLLQTMPLQGCVGTRCC